MIINKNEITKSEFDEMSKEHDFDQFTPRQVATALLSIKSLMEKGEKEELSPEELDVIKSGTAELNNLTKYTINDMVEGTIMKSDVFIQPKQVKWLDVIEKSDTGEKIEKGIYLDTPLNKELERVGVVFEKGKPVQRKTGEQIVNDLVKSMANDGKSEDDILKACKSKGLDADGGKVTTLMKAVEDEKKKKEAASKEMMDNDMYKSATSMIKEGKEDKNGMYKALKKKYPKMDASTMKDYMNKAYKNMGNDYLKKADVEIEGDDEDDDNKKEKSKVGFAVSGRSTT